MQKNTKLGWIGLGVVGEPMCAHMLVMSLYEKYVKWGMGEVQSRLYC